jgi:cellulose synthase/poly-beta-1,6-N-acetylglucosamine synthase-like glycosyltransferase
MTFNEILMIIRTTKKQSKKCGLKISLLVPCYNEEKSLEASIRACLNQTRKFDELVFVDDFSKDRTPEILAQYADRIIVRRTPQNTGNKSSAQEFGLRFVTGDIMVTTDADTLLDPKFAEEIEKSFQNPKVVAVAGYVKSLPYNWLTLCRAFDYAIGQNIHKLAQDYMNYIFVMPGAASAFRTEVFRKYITFDHDTLTEDLDFTYKLHHNRFKIVYNPKAISYTQDPADLKNYINQMRRWFCGGWQNLMKHYSIIPTRPVRAFELSLIYAEGLIFSVLLFLIPVLNVWFGLWILVGYFVVAFAFAAWAAWREKRFTLLLAPFPYMIIIFVNAYIYLEQFVREVIFKRKNLIWFKPERVTIDVK